MTAAFDNETWQKSRLDRAQRMEINVARRIVSAGHVDRVCAPGKWRVYKTPSGSVVTEMLGGER